LIKYALFPAIRTSYIDTQYTPADALRARSRNGPL
jgi:hypothetical protein